MSNTNDVTINFLNGAFIVENHTSQVSSVVSVPLLQSRKHFVSTEKIINYLKKSAKCDKNSVLLIEQDASQAIEVIVSYNKLRQPQQ